MLCKKTIFLIVLLAVPALSLSEGATGKRLSPQEMSADFAILKESLYKFHPDIHLYTSESEFADIVEHAEGGLTEPLREIEFYRKLLPVIAAVRNNHTDLSPSQPHLDYMSGVQKRFPLSFHLVDGTLYSKRDVSNEYEVREGSIVKEINGWNAVQLIHDMAKLASTDGFNTTNPLSRMSRNFVSYYALFIGSEDVHSIRYVDSAGVESIATIDAITIEEIVKNRDQRYPQAPGPESKEYWLEIKGSVAILSIATFQPESERKYRSFLKKTFRQFHDLGIDQLVIDVRNNRGGFPESAYKLLSYLISDVVSPVKESYALVDKLPTPNHFEKDSLLRHFERKRFELEGNKFHVRGESDIKIKPGQSPFHGSLFVLLNEYSASATAEFLGLVHANRDAVFIGTESGSSPITQVATDIVTLTLPHSGITLRIPLIKTASNVAIENSGQGFVPDFTVVPTIDDLLNGKDVDMEKAFELIQNTHLAHP